MNGIDGSHSGRTTLQSASTRMVLTSAAITSSADRAVAGVCQVGARSARHRSCDRSGQLTTHGFEKMAIVGSEERLPAPPPVEEHREGLANFAAHGGEP